MLGANVDEGVVGNSKRKIAAKFFFDFFFIFFHSFSRWLHCLLFDWENAILSHDWHDPSRTAIRNHHRHQCRHQNRMTEKFHRAKSTNCVRKVYDFFSRCVRVRGDEFSLFFFFFIFIFVRSSNSKMLQTIDKRKKRTKLFPSDNSRFMFSDDAKRERDRDRDTLLSSNWKGPKRFSPNSTVAVAVAVTVIIIY